MKIVHLCLNVPFNEGWGYQDNLLPKYQVMHGAEVLVLATDTMFENGIVVNVPEETFVSQDGYKVIRLKAKNVPVKALRFIEKYDIYGILEEFRPDLIFSHGLLNITMLQAIKYKKKYGCRIVQDNHQDWNNSPNAKFKKLRSRLLHGYYILLNRYTQKHVEKIYGVTPCRIDFAQDYFKVSSKKTDLLIMGASDEKINFAEKNNIRQKIRNELGVADNTMLIVTGGKIEPYKKIVELMDAVKNIEADVKLLVFGSPVKGYEKTFSEHINENVINIGWIPADAVYDYFFASDLAFFPGLHSVLWEQACASKIPCVFRRLDGMDHVDCGGNSDFIDDVTAEGIKNKITELLFTDKYYKLKEVAESDKTDIYLYSNIAKKSMEVLD